MLKRSLRFILPIFAALGVACRRDIGFDPGPRVLTGLNITPTYAALSSVAPGNTLQLTLQPYDQTGAIMSRRDAFTYSSSAPAIAMVSSSGVVTAAGTGAARITAALTVGGITRTASMIVTVFGGDLSDIAGVYDLSAVITSFDPAWGYDLAGYRYTAVLTLHQESVPPLIRGTYADWWLIGPLGDSLHLSDSGAVTSYIGARDRFVIELVGPGDIIDLSLIPVSVTSESIAGGWGCCGHIAGAFTATRSTQ